METDDVSVREQLFHNRVRETIVSNAEPTVSYYAYEPPPSPRKQCKSHHCKKVASVNAVYFTLPSGSTTFVSVDCTSYFLKR